MAAKAKFAASKEVRKIGIFSIPASVRINRVEGEVKCSAMSQNANPKHKG